MLNLLKFKPAGGAASYMEYVRHVRPILERIGAKIIFAGPVASTAIGDQSLDSILLVEYPLRKVFVDMVTSAEHQAIHIFATRHSIVANCTRYHLPVISYPGRNPDTSAVSAFRLARPVVDGTYKNPPIRRQ